MMSRVWIAVLFVPSLVWLCHASMRWLTRENDVDFRWLYAMLVSLLLAVFAMAGLLVRVAQFVD